MLSGWLLLTVLFLAAGIGSAKAQRVYATTQTKSPKQTLLVVTLSDVTNESNATSTSSFSDYSTLFTTVGALSLIEAWQNLRFTGSVVPQSNSPVTIMFGANSSIADVINGISIQTTNNGTLVGSPYSSSTLIGLLGSGAVDKEITLPAPGITYDGIRYQVSPSVLGVAVTGRYYYAFFITPPSVSSQTICNDSPVTLTVSNPQSGYTYNWYSVATGGTALQSGTSNTYTPPTNLTSTTTYYVEAVETGATNYYSGRTAVTVTVKNPPTTATVGSNQNLCSVSGTTITANTPTTGSGAWSQVSGPNTAGITSPAAASTAITGMIPGTYVFRWTISNAPCPASTADITVVVGAPVTASNAGTAQNLCAVTNTTLAGNAPTVGTGTWTQVSGPSTASFTNANVNNTTATNLVAGDYVFRWTISSGSCPTSASTVNVRVAATPTTADAGLDQNLCNVTSTTLAGNSPTIGTGTWTRISGPNTPTITTPSANNSTLTGMVPGTYVYQWSIANTPCTASTDQVSITISAPPTTAAAGTNQNLCSTTSTTLAGNTPTVGTGVWTQLSGPNTAAITTPSAGNSGITGLIAGTYVFRWTISNTPCTASTSDVTVVIGITPTITLGTAPSACKEVTSAAMIYTATTGSPTTYSIVWGSAALTAGFANVSDASLPASPINLVVPATAAMAAYPATITVKNASGCQSTAVPFTFTVHPKPATPSFSVTTSN